VGTVIVGAFTFSTFVLRSTVVAPLTVKSPLTAVEPVIWVEPEMNTDWVNGLINDAVLAKDADNALIAYEELMEFNAQLAVPNKDPVNEPVNDPVALTTLPLTINP